MKKQKGFTLIELMILLAIVGMLSVLSIKIYQESKQQSKQSTIKSVKQYNITSDQCVYGYVVLDNKQLIDNKGYGVPCN